MSLKKCFLHEFRDSGIGDLKLETGKWKVGVGK